MADGERIRNSDWENDMMLKADLERYVHRNLQRQEILDFVRMEYPMYAWSIRTLARRLHFFEIKYTDYSIPVVDVQSVVRKEVKGPGGLLGYRSMQDKVRQLYEMNVPRDLVDAVM